MNRGILSLSLVLCLLLALFTMPLPAQANGVTVSVDAPATVAPGDDFEARVDISEVTDFDACNFDVVFDPSVLSLTAVDSGIIDGTVIPLVAPPQELAAGRWRITQNVSGFTGVTGSGYLCKLHFHVTGSGGTSSSINLENGMLSDFEANSIPATWVGATVNVASPTEPTIAFSPTSLSFSATEGGANPADQTLEVWNSGTGTLDWSVSDNATWLSLSPTSGSSTGEYDSVTVSVDIAGMSAGDSDATITISAPGATNTPQTASVSLHIAAAPEPDISVSPTAINFGDITVGSSSSAQPVTVSNVGTADLVVDTITITGDADQFSKQNDNCSGETIAPDGSATLEVVFSPTSTGAKSATLNIPSNDADEPTVTVSLIGNGVTGLTYTLTVDVSPSGGGDIEVNGTAPASYPHDTPFAEGTSVDLKAVPASGYEFDHWSGDLSGSTNPDTITMEADKSVTANFTEIPTPAPAPTLPPEEPELSARLSIRNLTVTPVYVEAGQPVTISADVVNDGGMWGSGTVNLIINGQFEQSRGVGVSPGTAQPVSFTVYKTEPGEYEIRVVINGIAAVGSAHVIEPPAPEAGRLSVGELGTGGIIAIVVIAIILVGGITGAFLYTRRRSY